MLKHIVTLIWNRKRKNVLMIVEIFISFIVLFAIVSFSLEKYTNYIVPDGIDYNNVWVVEFQWEKDTKDQIIKKFKLISNELKNISEIKGHSFSAYSTPYTYRGSRSRAKKNGKSILVNRLVADENFVNVMGMKVVDGRDFNELDASSRLPSYLISKKLADEIFPNKDYLGEKKLNETGENDMNIVGVYEYFQKESPLKVSKASTLKLKPLEKVGFSSIFINVSKNSTAELEEKIMKCISTISKTWSVKIERLAVKRANLIEREMLSVYTFGIISLFLILNVALGLFGVLWFNIQNRKSEIGLRRVFGAISSNIQMQIIMETMVLTLLGLIFGLFFALQVPLLGLFDVAFPIYMKAIIFSILFILIISILCAFYPSRIASRITPALVLHDD